MLRCKNRREPRIFAPPACPRFVTRYRFAAPGKGEMGSAEREPGEAKASSDSTENVNKDGPPAFGPTRLRKIPTRLWKLTGDLALEGMTKRRQFDLMTRHIELGVKDRDVLLAPVVGEPFQAERFHHLSAFLWAALLGVVRDDSPAVDISLLKAVVRPLW